MRKLFFLLQKRMCLLLLGFLLIVFGMASERIDTLNLPAQYDLRNISGNSYITPVKTQVVPGEMWNCVGLCWAFSSLASFESSLLQQGIIIDPESALVNFSPWHIGCHIGYNHPNYTFNTHLVGNPLIPINYQLDETMQYGYGGSLLFTIDYLSTGRGVVLEQDAPVPLEDMKAHATLIPPEKDMPEYYLLRDAFIYECADYPEDEAYRQAIKRAIINHGAVSTAMFLCASDCSWQTGTGFFRDEHQTDYCCDDLELVNQLRHMVTIVGWNDAYRMKDVSVPGAWLIKDSMGSYYHDHGYLWISYNDTVFLKGYSYAVAFVGDQNDGYSRRCYQTHVGALSHPVKAETMYESDGFFANNQDSWACARFFAKKSEQLKAIGLVTMNPGECLTVEVYEKWDELAEAPSELLYSEPFFIEEKGYHVLDLSEPLVVKGDQEFVLCFGFEYHQNAQHEPLVVVFDDDISTANQKTYYSSNHKDWKEYAHVNQQTVVYMQAIMSD